MKKLLHIIIFILLISIVFATDSIFIKDSIGEGETKVYETNNGAYVIELMIVSGSSAKFKVNNKVLETLSDGNSNKLSDGSELVVKKVLADEGSGEVDFYFYGSGENPLDINIGKTWDSEKCNFDSICQETESKSTCCYDCNCESGYECESNSCVKKGGCVEDEECQDNNPCTEDACQNNKCSYEKTQGCILEDECLPQETIKTIDNIKKYCENENWKAKKEIEENCIEDYECLTNSCRDNKCYKMSLKGLFIFIVLLVIISLIFYAGKKSNIHKKIKKRLFWKF